MAHIDCTFALSDFTCESPWGQDGMTILILSGEGMALELFSLELDAVNYLIEEIQGGLSLSEKERRGLEFEELLYKIPEQEPNKLRFVFAGVGGLQALYQPPDKLWQMVFDDLDDDSQVHVMMSTHQVESLLTALKRQADPCREVM